MLYLVCRTDQLTPILRDPPAPISGFSGSNTYYPRIVEAEGPEDAIDRAFYPERFEPGGVRKLSVIELGEFFNYIARPRAEYVLERVR